jgi:DNA-binding Lrp family transcriptional regulator
MIQTAFKLRKTLVPDEIDRELLQILQDDFPMVSRPWKEVGDKLNISEDEVIARLKRLREDGVIQKVGPVLDSSKIGLTATTLVAMKIPESRVDTVSRIINQYSNVSHNYLRDHEYNLWFTMTASDNEELSALLNEITEKTGVAQDDILNLPTLQRFKIDVRFQLAQTAQGERNFGRS